MRYVGLGKFAKNGVVSGLFFLLQFAYILGELLVSLGLTHARLVKSIDLLVHVL